MTSKPFYILLIYPTIKKAWDLVTEVQNREQVLAGYPVGSPSIGQLACGPSHKIDSHSQEIVSLECCSMLLYPIDDIDNTPQYILLKPMITIIWGQLTGGAHHTIVRSYQLDLNLGTELQIQVKEFLFDDGYLSDVVDEKKLWFMRMTAVDLIYHRFLFTTNRLGR